MYDFNWEGNAHFRTGVVCSSVSTIAVCIRIFCKMHYKIGFQKDDHWMLFSLGLMWSLTVSITWGLFVTGGIIDIQSMIDLAFEDFRLLERIEQFSMLLSLSYTLYVLLVFSIKMSILTYYTRLFSVKPIYRRLTRLAILLSALCCISGIVGNLATCLPVDAFWHPKAKSRTCLNIHSVTLAFGVADTIIDVFILALPLHMAFALHLQLRKRIALASIFVLAGFCIVTNIVRLQLTYIPDKRFITFDKRYIWFQIHLATAIVSACLPTYKKLLDSVSEAISKYLIHLGTCLGLSKTVPEPERKEEKIGKDIKVDVIWEHSISESSLESKDDVFRTTVVNGGVLRTECV